MSSCMSAYKPGAEIDISAISPAQAAKYQNRAGVEFVDPRPAEVIANTTGIIPGARNITMTDIEAGVLPDAFGDRSIHVITTCEAGPMAARAAEIFATLGFARVSYVEGGTRAWLAAGLPTAR